ncbi:GNAT family N-acetyltransferase [Sphingosinicella sp. LY1275]|uniref:GNAT family N-acetyltransferase n=1 Tax=Sphingosinicella sp. LY1275 TaxID=3095379 RepID=UPI002ADEF4F7|nr:GNAT family N-acetyltransferase [Sphingosinicella sp. LY1275]MEA1013075.1 GNAT family N-acetyltransferase [Sphingosinicella sp. LY1275]
MSAVTLRHATSADAAALAAFAAHVFEQTFGPENTPEDMADYLRTTYAPDLQREEIAEAGSEVVLAEMDGAIVGYSYFRAGPAPGCVKAERPFEICRFYVDRDQHGRGIAAALMERTLAAAAPLGDAIWLSVWEHNGRALSFYRRYGFETVGERGFQLGSDLQRDLLMARPL